MANSTLRYGAREKKQGLEALPRERRETVARLVGQLEVKDPVAYLHAMEQLVVAGREAIPALVTALTHTDSQVRWRAARILGRIRDRSAADALVLALEDDVAEVSWRAAEALGALGEDGLAALLHALMARSHSSRLRQGAHHVVRLFDSTPLAEQLKEVRNALESAAPIVAVPVAAYHAIVHLEERRPSRSTPHRQRVR
jgi:HEAT repeat protein